MIHRPRTGTSPGRARSGRTRLARTRPGFSLVEMLFAVMVLGIGFIMVAGLFPVAIRQNQNNVEQTAGAMVAQSAFDVLDQAVSAATLPPTSSANDQAPVVLSLRDAKIDLWAKVRGNLVLPSDTRIAWTPLYARRKGDTYAQFFVFATQVRSRSTYDSDPGSSRDLIRYKNDASTTSGDAQATLEPRRLGKVVITRGTNGAADTIDFGQAQDLGGPGDSVGAVVQTAYVIVSEDTTPQHVGYCNGWIYRIGNPVPTSGAQATKWELMPGGDMGNTVDPGPDGKLGTADDITTIQGTVYIIGRGYNNPGDPSKGLGGGAQDIATYTTFLRLR